jgi:hypothetical protein
VVLSGFKYRLTLGHKEGEIMLKFNSKACIAALKAEMLVAMEKCITELYMELVGSLKGGKAKQDVVKEKAKIRAGIITGKVISGAYAIMDSYGTGSLMDMSNPFLDEYMATASWSVPMYNPIRLQRNTTAILGRSKGRYRPIVGGRRTSSGRMEGLNLEELASTVTKSGRIKSSTNIKPTPPSKAIDTSFRWMAQTRINKVVMETVQKFDFSRFFEYSVKKKG